MSGLLERATKLRVRGRNDEDGISPEERSRILEEINRRMSTQGRVTLGPASVRRKRGLALPLLVNGLALAILLVGSAIFARLEREGPAKALGASATELVTESRLLEAVRSTAASAVAERDRRIAAIQAELVALGRQGPSASTPADSERESELRAELAALSSTANARLAELGKSREKENFFFTQLRSLYHETASLARSGDYAAARVRVAAANRLVASDGAAAFAPALLEGQAALDDSLAIAQSLSGGAGEALAAQQKATAEAAAEAAAQAERAAAAEFAAARARVVYEARIAELRKRDDARTEHAATIARNLSLALDAAKAKLAGAAAASDQAEGPLLDLLATKVRLREIANSPDIRASYPGLYAKLDLLFAAINREGESAGKERAWREAAAIVRSLAAGIETPPGRG
ncbi:MAG TPA: hypothetical protein VMV90_05270, partial [Rectinemataceae bacterium]|nr:hypothetical protein [Rectinemataceae bacterium]